MPLVATNFLSRSTSFSRTVQFRCFGRGERSYGGLIRLNAVPKGIFLVATKRTPYQSLVPTKFLRRSTSFSRFLEMLASCRRSWHDNSKLRLNKWLRSIFLVATRFWISTKVSVRSTAFSRLKWTGSLLPPTRSRRNQIPTKSKTASHKISRD